MHTTTYLYAGLLGLLLLTISVDTIMARIKFRVALGTGPKQELLPLTSAHHNFISYTPIFLLFLYLLEQSQQVGLWGIHLLGSAFFLGRLVHYFSMRGQQQILKIRQLGMICTFGPLLIISLLLLVTMK